MYPGQFPTCLSLNRPHQMPVSREVELHCLFTPVLLDTQGSIVHRVLRRGHLEVVNEPFTNRRLQDLLSQASNLGFNFDTNLVSGTPAEQSAPTSLTGETANGEAGAAAGDTGSTPDGADDAGTNIQPAESAVAISLKRSDNQFILDVTPMVLGPSPTVDDVLQLVKNCNDPNTRAIRQELEQSPPEQFTVGTARKPISFRILDQYAGDAVVGYRSLGTLKEAVNEAMILEPCIDCAETEDLRKFRTPPIPSSTPVFILYCQRQVSSGS